MSQQESRSPRSDPSAVPSESEALTIWQMGQHVLGWVLILTAVGVLALYYLGDVIPGVGAELQARLKGGDGKTNSTGVLLVFVSLVLLSMFLLRSRLQGGRTLWGLVFVGMVFTALASNLLPRELFWGWVLAALPALLVIHHGIYLGLMKPRVISREMLDGNHQSHLLDDVNIKDMVDSNDRYFNTSNIALRYGLPALAIITVGAVVFFALNPVSEGALNKILREPLPQGGKEWILYSTLEAARLGAVGAYVYVLLYLGQRGFQHDITSGAALWCAVTLALGPLMAAAMSKIWIAGMGSTGEPTGWSTQVLYFGVGMSPQYATQVVTRAVRRMGMDASKPVAPERSVPLSMLRGITPAIEERLREEGIHDVAGMAMADPLRIQRNTNFDKHQILGWIDAALLAQALPESWQDLEKKGLRGARDLIWYVSGNVEEKKAGLQELATDGLSETVLKDVALRLSQDAQAQRTQVLYQLVDLGGRTAPGSGTQDAPVSASGQMATTIQGFPEATSGRSATAAAGAGEPAKAPEAPATASQPPQSQG